MTPDRPEPKPWKGSRKAPAAVDQTDRLREALRKHGSRDVGPAVIAGYDARVPLGPTSLAAYEARLLPSRNRLSDEDVAAWEAWAAEVAALLRDGGELRAWQMGDGECACGGVAVFRGRDVVRAWSHW